MGGNTIRTQNTDVERGKFHPSYTKLLLSFNITKQRVADFCNQEWKDDPFEKEVNYSSWHRAMEGHEVWVGVISQLEGLYEAQKRTQGNTCRRTIPVKICVNGWNKSRRRLGGTRPSNSKCP